MVNKITKKEKKKALIWAAMVVLGIMFASALKDMFLDDLLNKYPAWLMILLAGCGMWFLYYKLDMD